MQKLVPAYSGRAFTTVRCHPERIKQPLRWRRPRRVFVNSMSDLFHHDVPDSFIADVFRVMREARQHTFQILTKRPERAVQWFSKIREWNSCMVYQRDAERADFVGKADAWPLPNVWIGISVEDQAAADERIPLLLKISAAVRFLSVEPMLGPISFEGMFANPSNPADGTNMLECIDWVIVGGESGPNARPMHPAWGRSLRDQCEVVGVPFLFKQWGAWEAANVHPQMIPVYVKSCILNTDGTLYHGPSQSRPCGAEGMLWVGRKATNRLLDGAEHNAYPGGK